jgi:uncharacterized Zn finger protein
MYEVAAEEIFFSKSPQFSYFLLLLHTHQWLISEACDCPDQAACCHIFGLYLGLRF